MDGTSTSTAHATPTSTLVDDAPIPRRTFGARPSSSTGAASGSSSSLKAPQRPSSSVRPGSSSSAHSPGSFSQSLAASHGYAGPSPQPAQSSGNGGSFPFLAETQRRSSSSSSNPHGSSGSIPHAAGYGSNVSLPAPSPSSTPVVAPVSAASPKPFENAADRASAWLSTWAPRGEGRGREFLTSTLSGVANVAGTVGQGIGTTVGHLGSQLREEGLRHQRLSSFSGILDGARAGVGERPASAASVESDSALAVSPPSHGTGIGHGIHAAHSGSTASLPSGTASGIGAALGAGSSPTNGTASASQLAGGPALPAGRKIPQPANLARLGAGGGGMNVSGASSASPPLGSSARPALSNPSTSTTVPSASNQAPSIPRSFSSSLAGPSAQPHGPSHLNPNARPSSSTSNLNTPAAGHVRAQSFGGAIPSPAMSRTSSGTATPGVGAGPSHSNTHTLSWQPRHTGQPYKLGFQPAGARNDRTQEYLGERTGRMVELEKEEGRLGRRWAKLVDLHFNPMMQTVAGQSPPTLPRSGSSSRTLAQQGHKRSSILGGGALDAWRPKEVWRSMKDVAAPVIKPGEEDNRRRAAEQAIVKWEDDSDAKKCRICHASFNLSTRKHHCRLCGRIVCSLPPTPAALLAVQVQLFAPASPTSPTTPTIAPLPAGTRREKCSLLLVADYRTYRGEEVDEGFVGWMKLRSPTDPSELNGGEDSSPAGSSNGHSRHQNQAAATNKAEGGRRRGMSISSIRSGGTASSAGGGSMRGEDGLPLPKQPKEVQIKGVRVCRECWTTVSRKQKMADRQRVTKFAKLYAMLRQLQAEIEDAMPEFEDAMEILAASDNPDSLTAATVQMHRNLLALIAQYEHLSKRMSALPVAEGSSQASVQSAVARSAALFLGTQMAKVQALPKLQKQLAAAKRKALSSLPALVEQTTLAELGELGGEGRKAEDVALELQPLLEQEAQLESMAEEAKRQRKYEDGKALAMALQDIRAEIARISQGFE